MIDLVYNNHHQYALTPLTPILDEFEAEIRQSLGNMSHYDLKDKLLLEAKIYGDLVQTMDKHGQRTYGLATAIKKYYHYFVVEIFINSQDPQTIRVIKIPLKQNSTTY